MKKEYLLGVLLFLSLILFSEDNEEKSIRYERTQNLKWGIDSDVIELLKKLESNEENTFGDIIFERFKKSSQQEIKVACINYFKHFKYEKVKNVLKEILRNPFDHDPSVVKASLEYFSEFSNDDIIDLILPLIDMSNQKVAIQSLNTLGKIGNAACIPDLLKRLNDPDFNSSLKPSIVLAFGEIASSEASEALIKILDNDDEEPVLRRYACDSLGKIGDTASIDPLIRAYTSGDLLLRSYAISSLGYFSGHEVLSLLLDSLTDSSLKIRIAGIRGLGNQKIVDKGIENEIIDGLIFKVKKDPEVKVRLEAMATIAKLNTKRSLFFLTDIYKNKNSSFELRVSSFDGLLLNFLDDSIKTFETVIKDEWSNKNSRIMDYTCKKLSTTKNNGLKSIFSRLLTHNSFIIQIYGIRGIRLNSFSEFKGKIEELSKKKNKYLKREAEYALEML